MRDSTDSDSTRAGNLRQHRDAAGLNPKTLSTHLGYATITLDRYGHLMPGSEVEARAMPDDYLNGAD
jgi:hypothetical protein